MTRFTTTELLKNESELLFEAYLKASGVSDYVFEKPLPGTSRRPDYAVPWGGREILFELKEFRAEVRQGGPPCGNAWALSSLRAFVRRVARVQAPKKVRAPEWRLLARACVRCSEPWQ